MATRLLYLESMQLLDTQARIISIVPHDTLYKIVLDQTIFYPQGGGQPSDQGTITKEHALFDVQAVTLHDGLVYHSGTVRYGYFNEGDQVTLHVNQEVRILHNKNHTAGHLIDYGLAQLGYAFIPVKGYHFPHGPYVEYQGTLEQHEREQLQNTLEKVVNQFVANNLPVRTFFIDNNSQKRVMVAGDNPPILCGGTHVPNTQNVGHITIRKIKNEKGNLRISYAVS